ncbi:MAG: hypothetical protein AAF212_01925 [Verrucomicrobiota bacterium]
MHAEVKLYPFAYGDRLGKERNTYQYTEFLGRDFLRAWKESRFRCIPIQQDLEENRETAARTHQSVISSFQELEFQITQETGLSASEILGFLILKFEEGNIEDNLTKWSNLWIKKFEITKRVYDRYKGLKLQATGAKSYEDISLYLMLADLFIRYAQADSNLPAINALLKIMDSLASRSQEFDATDRALFIDRANQEAALVDELARSVNVSL